MKKMGYLLLCGSTFCMQIMAQKPITIKITNKTEYEPSVAIYRFDSTPKGQVYTRVSLLESGWFRGSVKKIKTGETVIRYKNPEGEDRYIYISNLKGDLKSTLKDVPKPQGISFFDFAPSENTNLRLSIGEKKISPKYTQVFFTLEPAQNNV